ncbi:cytochrome oxidase assembly protein SHY1 [Lachancea thermotolerans CBS 6340]|uniref:SURF1-like protein n=1 Tax=Lachancea thermotolerans (strain ATCC 56472 / CBS 6340 / NRRL Y-8284) TaxID=559295 RepID=C5DJ69_LACTC|nr:KLTH0F13970p [Lachancea thermotolerans CBS 6340]CAR24358.1 KLTH0F13970p [Lachancea thermotolerans CBS 6340]
MLARILAQDALKRSVLRARPRASYQPFRRSVKTSSVDWKPIKSSKTPNDEKHKKPFTRMIFLSLMIAMPVVAFYLGSWQLRRLKWKTNLIALCEDRLTFPATPLPKNFPPEEAENWEYRKVKVKGEFKHDQELFVGPRVRNGVKGYLLFTPFVRKDTGEKLLIERGWISEEKVVPTSRRLEHLSVPEGDNVEIECLVRVPRSKGTFQWDKTDQDSRLWQIVDIPEMCAVSGASPLHLQAIYDLKDHNWSLSEASPSTAKGSWWKFWQKPQSSLEPVLDTKTNLAEDPEMAEFNEFQFVKSGVPIGKVPKIDLKNNHLQYLVTWYGLSFLSTIFLIVALRRNRGGAVSQAQLKRDKLKHAKKYM